MLQGLSGVKVKTETFQELLRDCLDADVKPRTAMDLLTAEPTLVMKAEVIIEHFQYQANTYLIRFQSQCVEKAGHVCHIS